jgi:hypothetical protein
VLSNSWPLQQPLASVVQQGHFDVACMVEMTGFVFAYQVKFLLHPHPLFSYQSLFLEVVV